MFASNLRDPGFGWRSRGDLGASGASNSFNKIPETSFGNREQRTEDRGQRTEDREQRTEDRTEDRGQRTEDRGQDGRQRTQDIGQRLRRDNVDRRIEQKAFAAVCPVGAGGYIYIYIYIWFVCSFVVFVFVCLHVLIYCLSLCPVAVGFCFLFEDVF